MNLILFTTFEAYARARWDIGRSQAYRLIDAYKVIGNLSPIGDRLPGNETQTRSLVPLSPPKQRKICKDFLNTGMEITACNIKNFINKRKTKQTNPSDHTDQISNDYMDAVQEMLDQIRYAQNDYGQKRFRKALC